MVVKENNDTYRSKSWILRIGGETGSSGFFATRKECMQDAEFYGYEFYTDIII